MAPRMKNLIPDMTPTRYQTQTFNNPYAPVAPKPVAPKEMNRTSGVARRAAPNQNFYNPIMVKARTPFKGDDPFSQTARSIWDTPGAVAQGFADVFSGKRKITGDQWLELGANVAVGGMLAAAGVTAARSGIRARASTASLAASRIRNAAEIAANAQEARLQFRRAVDARQAERRARQSTLVRADRLERIETALRDRDPGAAQAFGDRAYALRAGKTIRTEMRGAKGHEFTDSPFAGSHHSYVPMDRSVPFSNMGVEWMRTSGRPVTALANLYSSRIPRGGYMVRPNFRKRTPITSQYTPDLKNRVIDPSAVDDYTRDRIAPLLDDATVFRNRSASMLQGNRRNNGTDADYQGRHIFPRIYDASNTTNSGFDPAEYQLRTFYNYTSMLRRGTATTLPRRTRYVRPNQRRIGGGQ